jgi:PPOX class probable F420-dependent enzyme
MAITHSVLKNGGRVTTDEAATLDVLDGNRFANVTTFRANGDEVITPVWFVRLGSQVFVRTDGESGKVKRLRANPAALLGPCDQHGEPLGPTVQVVGRILGTAEGVDADHFLTAKYGFRKRLFDFFIGMRGTTESNVFLAFTVPSDD